MLLFPGSESPRGDLAVSTEPGELSTKQVTESAPIEEAERTQLDAEPGESQKKAEIAREKSATKLLAETPLHVQYDTCVHNLELCVEKTRYMADGQTIWVKTKLVTIEKRLRELLLRMRIWRMEGFPSCYTKSSVDTAVLSRETDVILSPLLECFGNLHSHLLRILAGVDKIWDSTKGTKMWSREIRSSSDINEAERNIVQAIHDLSIPLDRIADIRNSIQLLHAVHNVSLDADFRRRITKNVEQGALSAPGNTSDTPTDYSASNKSDYEQCEICKLWLPYQVLPVHTDTVHGEDSRIDELSAPISEDLSSMERQLNLAADGGQTVPEVHSSDPAIQSQAQSWALGQKASAAGLAPGFDQPTRAAGALPQTDTAPERAGKSITAQTLSKQAEKLPQNTDGDDVVTPAPPKAPTPIPQIKSTGNEGIASGQPVTKSPEEVYRQFCFMVGMDEERFHRSKGGYWPGLNFGVASAGSIPGLYPRVQKAYNEQRIQYLLLGAVFNAGLIVQIIVGGTVAGLGGTLSRDGTGIAITVLGALQAFLGGILAYLIGKNQPNRARHLTHELETVLNSIEDADVQFRSGTYVGVKHADNGREENREMQVEDVVRMLTEAFETTLRKRIRDYPDHWVASLLGGNTLLGTSRTQEGGKVLREPAETASRV